MPHIAGVNTAMIIAISPMIKDRYWKIKKQMVDLGVHNSLNIKSLAAMIQKLNVIDSRLNEIGKNFDYRKKEILFDRFKGWFDHTTFTLISTSMGWGRWESSCGTLYIGTASFDGGCWLDTVQHKNKANNPHNNFVNAIAYWDMLNSSGKKFFLEFYKNEFFMLKHGINSKISDFQSRIKYLQNELLQIDTEIDNLNDINS